MGRYAENLRAVGHTPGGAMILADLKRIRTPFPFYAVIPQWDFLDLGAVNERVTRPKREEPPRELGGSSASVDWRALQSLTWSQ